MIRLNLELTEVEMEAPPVALRLKSASKNGSAATTSDATYEIVGDEVVARASFGHFRFRISDERDFDGDVLLVFPEERRATRLIRSGANSNTILLTEECDQVCVMCSQPPRNRRYAFFDLYADACRLAPPSSVIGISGGEPTLLKTPLLEMMRNVIRERSDLRFHVLTNAQHFGPEDEADLSALAEHVLWGVPLYADTPGVHDAIVGKQGAYERLIESLLVLRRATAQVELRTVLLSQNLDNLPRLAEFISTHLKWITYWAIMQIEHFGYARLNWDNIFVDTSVRSGQLSACLDICRARATEVALYNFPLCTVPAQYRSLAHASISDWKQRYLDVCAECSARDTCGGFFEWYPEKKGYRGIRPI